MAKVSWGSREQSGKDSQVEDSESGREWAGTALKLCGPGTDCFPTKQGEGKPKKQR